MYERGPNKRNRVKRSRCLRQENTPERKRNWNIQRFYKSETSWIKQKWNAQVMLCSLELASGRPILCPRLACLDTGPLWDLITPSQKLEEYVSHLSHSAPGCKSWSRKLRLDFIPNLYFLWSLQPWIWTSLGRSLAHGDTQFASCFDFIYYMSWNSTN